MISLFITFLTAFYTLLIVLAVTGTSLGLQTIYIRCLVWIFEWGASISRDQQSESSIENEEKEEASTNQDHGLRQRHSSGDLGIIRREKTDIIDTKLHSTELPPHRKTTVEVFVDDTLDFIAAGIEAIIEDQVTSRFSAEQLSSWNLLTRTRYSFHYVNWKLTILWFCGFLVRYLILVPMRIFLFWIAIFLLVALSTLISYIPNPATRKNLNRHCMLVVFRICSMSFSSRIRFHDRENRAKKGGICVANHTSPIDIMILSCDNCYALIGQQQPGFLGFLQNTLSKSESHIWFERSEAADRRKVTQRLREHVEDEEKLPIIIFPEGTCINNTSVMMFKKGSFEIGSTIYPIAMKYDSRLTDAFWNSSEQSYGEYLWRMMTSWCIICDVWYLPPITRMESEDAVSFARRVKRAIAMKGGLIDLEWDGALKRERVSAKLISLQQKLYYDRLARTTTLGTQTDKEMKELQTELLEVMQTITEEERNKLLQEIDDECTSEEDEIILKKQSSKDKDLSDSENMVLCNGGCNGHDHLSATLKKQYFVTPRSGNNSGYEDIDEETKLKNDELVKLCGEIYDMQVSTRGNNATLRFHSDSYAGERGGRISYIAVEENKCEPDWMKGPYELCYKLIEQDKVDFVTAQKRCKQQQSNLAYVHTELEYSFIKNFSENSHSQPWIGYYDAANEGTLMYINGKDTKIYPENPKLANNNDRSDCVYLDFDRRNEDQIEYRMDNCQLRHSYICSKARNGSTVLIAEPASTVKAGTMSSDTEYTFWLLVFLALILFLIFLCIICNACYKKNEQSRVGDVNGGSRTDARSPLATNSEAVKTSAPVIVPPSRTSNQPPVVRSPTGAAPRQAELPPTPPPIVTKIEEHPQPVPVPVTRKISKIHAQTTREEVNTEIMAAEPIRAAQSERQLPPLPLRENTYHSMNTREESFLRTRRGNELFERPKMAVLDSVSAISLDEFWSNDKK
ncbi:hypothetical protein WR25_00167 [Diploscapter pachys]|uniref:C-type lectin domain-containing protein n=1 Tax=Diploscapter pachys TaxID=2018661 RepID=A0A2A2JLZ7_9BILA|nr:hypothetical protein WR25_00167 [Diploscapter pachys]